MHTSGTGGLRVESTYILFQRTWLKSTYFLRDTEWVLMPLGWFSNVCTVRGQSVRSRPSFTADRDEPHLRICCLCHAVKNRIRPNCKTHLVLPQSFHFNQSLVFPFQFCCSHQREAFSHISQWIAHCHSEILKILSYSLLEVSTSGLVWITGENDTEHVCS